jgi:uncharacterized DUF497 family protein
MYCAFHIWVIVVEKRYKKGIKIAMRLEFNPEKSVVSQEKHGIDFLQAQTIWDDADFIEIPLKTFDEQRFLVIGMIEGKVWSGIITYRGESIRIISVRRSRKEEMAIYEG